jgi:hypothetical protein
MSLVDKAKDEVAREIARYRLPSNHNGDDISVRIERWNKLAKEAMPETEDKINEMSNIEFLELLDAILKDSA